MMNRPELPRTKGVGAASTGLLPFAALLLASALFLSACNTAEGVGDDVEEAGDEIGDAID